LVPAPAAFVDEATGAPAFGAYEGPLPAVRFPSLGLRERALRRKRWVYVAISTDDVWIAFAVVRTGYVASAFAFVYDLATRTMLADETALAPTLASRVADDPHARGPLASLRFARTKIACARTEEGISIDARIGAITIDATLVDARAPAALTAIARLGDGLANATEKRALLGVRGEARVGDRVVPLSNAVAGYDYTHGLLPRHTRWHWAFALGRDTSGEPIAFNLAEGFVGQAECAAFAGGRAHALAEPHFEVGDTWRLTADGIDLSFSPGAIHAQYTNLGVVRSKFVQPAGTFTGTIKVSGRERRVERLPGVVEDQDVLW
jgi:hypothetical protein